MSVALCQPRSQDTDLEYQSSRREEHLPSPVLTLSNLARRVDKSNEQLTTRAYWAIPSGGLASRASPGSEARNGHPSVSSLCPRTAGCSATTVKLEVSKVIYQRAIGDSSHGNGVLTTNCSKGSAFAH